MTDNNIVDVSVVANFLMLSDRRVQQLAKSGYIPKAARGKYDLKAAIQGYIGFLKAQIEEGDLDGEDGDLGDGSNRHKNRLLKARADKAEMELQELRGEVVKVEDVITLVASEYAGVRSALEGVPAKCANRLLNQDNIAVIIDVIQRELYYSLQSLKYDNTPDSEGDADA